MNKSDVLHRKVKPSEVTLESGSKFFGSVFLYVFLALAISALVFLASGFVLSLNSEKLAESYVYAFVFAIILYIPTLIWSRIAIRRNGKTMVPAYVTYSAVVGLLISPLVLFADFYSVAMSFGLTCMTFGFMSLIAWKSKKNLSTLGMLASGLFFGAIMLLLVNSLIGWLFPAYYSMNNWLISGLILVATIFITIFDLNQIKVLAQNGVTGKNIALSCALNLYVDFIYIFIRILSLVIRLRNK